MSTEHEASRTLVKSPPELWAECSEPGSLARHLMGSFGEIQITRLEPETTIGWEGERATGTVRIEPSGWGTRVTLTAQTDAEPIVEQAPFEETVDIEEEADAKMEATLEEADPALADDDPAQAGRRFRRLIARARGRITGRRRPFEASSAEVDPLDPSVAPESVELPDPPEAVKPPELPDPPDAVTPPEPAPSEPVDPQAILAAALDSLGQAHHRPFSRA